ncbi:MAG: hypothetical protein ACREQD_09855, partial [Candidatus Binataceae bacterium]
RMLWACVPRPNRHDAVEFRVLELEDGSSQQVAHLLRDGVWRESQVSKLELETASPYTPPARISATLAPGAISLEGAPDTFMTLSRPGSDGVRIHTSLGFASYRVAGAPAVGMYEYSRCVGELASGAKDPDDD